MRAIERELAETDATLRRLRAEQTRRTSARERARAERESGIATANDALAAFTDAVRQLSDAIEAGLARCQTAAQRAYVSGANANQVNACADGATEAAFVATMLRRHLAGQPQLVERYGLEWLPQ